MSFIRNAIIGALAAGAASMVACSTGPQGTPSSGSNSPTGAAAGATGNLGFQLQLGSGISVNSVTYTITNPTLPGFSTITSTFDVSNSTVSFSVALPVGTGYTLSLSATDTNGDPCMAGPVSFDIIAGQSQAVALTLVCAQTIDGGTIGPDVNVGSVTVTADASLMTTTFTSNCAAATVLSAAPAAQAVGSAISLIGAGIDPNFQSGDVSLAWSATGGAGTLTAATGSSSSFTCTGPGIETITLTASISTTGVSCPGIGSLAVQVTCTGTGAVDAGGPPDSGTPIDSGAPDAEIDTGTVVDSGPDSSEVDSGPDSGEVDAAAEAGVDAGPDTGSPIPDSGGGTPDTGTPDSGSGGPASPCTAEPCAASGPNSVQCKGSPNGVCTATEALVLAYDIAMNGATATSPTTKAGSCYYCMVASKCLDSVAKGTVPGVVTQNGKGLECEDPTSTTNVAANNPAFCRDALSCTLTSNHCTTTNAGSPSTDPNASVSDCFCGTNLGPACVNPGPIGVCKTNEQTDLGTTDPTTVQTIFTDGSQSPGGVGNQILNCALTALCNSCFK